MLLPVLRPGFVLRYDLLFVPRRTLSLALLGVMEGPPRQVPVEALVGLASWGVPAEWLEKLLLGAVFVAGAIGAGRLVPSSKAWPRVAAGLLYVWNPFVYERLSIGQWSLLVSYALLPWVAKAALDVRASEAVACLEGRLSPPPSATPPPGRIPKWSRLGLWLGAASVANPYGGVMAAFLAFAIASGPPWREAGRIRIRSMAMVIGLAALVSLPWLVPALLRPAPPPDSLEALRAFASRSDSSLGVTGSVLSLGGMWNTSLAPPIRGTWAWIPSLGIVLAAAIAGWRWLWRTRPPMTGILFAGLIAAGAALGVHVRVLGSAYRWMALNMPGGGLLRDSQKFAGLLALAYAIGFGSAIAAWTGTASMEGEPAYGAPPGRRSQEVFRALLPLAFCLLPLSLVPTMAWGLGGRLSTVSYPADWTDARTIVATDPRPGRMLVLPWHPHLPLRWNRNQVTLNPARAFFTRSVVTSDRLELRSGTLPAETPIGAVADALVRGRTPLPEVMQRLGARYLLLLKEADWRRYADRLDGLEPALDGPTLVLYRLRGPLEPLASATPPTAAVVGGDIITVLSLGLMAIGSIGGRRRVRPGLHYQRPRSRTAIVRHHEGGGS